MVSRYVAGKNEYLPIPIVEITMSEGLLEQNPDGKIGIRAENLTHYTYQAAGLFI